MDVEDIRPGQNFAQTIDDTIAKCGTVLVVIGPRWLSILEDRAQQHQPDYVNHEIESALKRKINIIPLLVGGASLSELKGLPDSLKELPFHQAAELRDANFKDDLNRVAKTLGGKGRVPRAAWIIGAAAIAAILIAVLSWRYAGSRTERSKESTQVQQLLNTAATQVKLTEYEPAFNTYGEALKADSTSRAAFDGQVDAAMIWLDNFHAVGGEGQKTEDVAAPALSRIMAVLAAGFARTDAKSKRAADIMAHIGWAHWLNEKIAAKEFGDAAEKALRQSLSIDPSNVYGNAMFGNWLLQTGGSLDEAVRHFTTAVKGGAHRSLVREMQLGVMTFNDDPGVRPELIKVADEMRKNKEPLTDGQKHRILANFSPTLHNHKELTESLSAVPPDDAWATYLWLDDRAVSGRELEQQRIQREFIHASILEIAGKNAESLAMLQQLQPELKSKGYNGRIDSLVADGIKRLQSKNN